MGYGAATQGGNKKKAYNPLSSPSLGTTVSKPTKSTYTPAKSTPTSYGPTTGISGGALGNTPLPKPAPVQGVVQNSYVNGSPGSRTYVGDGGGGDPGVSLSAAPAIDPNTDYLQEAGYIAQVGALKQALDAFNAQDTADRQRYDLDFDKGLRDLGFRDNTADITTDNLDDLSTKDVDESVAGRAWDWNDVLSASGRGYQNNVNDFAARGMLQSQGYEDMQSQLRRSLADQLGSMNTGRQTFAAGKDEAKTNYGVQDSAARQAAMVDAIARLQAGMALG